jgi:hypothetical protein
MEVFPLVIPCTITNRLCLCGFREKENFSRELFPAEIPEPGIPIFNSENRLNVSRLSARP